MNGGVLFCLLCFANILSHCNSQNSEINLHRLAWQRQIDRVKENERRLKEFIAKQRENDSQTKTIDVKGKTFDIFPANPLEDGEKTLENNPSPDQNVGMSLDIVEVSPKESHLAEAERLIKKYRTLIDHPSYAVTNKKNGRRDYLKEAEEFLKNYNFDGSLTKSSFTPSKKIKSPTLKQAAKKNVDISSPSPPSIKNKEDVTDILIQNVNTKEGLQAIVTELLKRRIEKLKSQLEK